MPPPGPGSARRAEPRSAPARELLELLEAVRTSTLRQGLVGAARAREAGARASARLQAGKVQAAAALDAHLDAEAAAVAVRCAEALAGVQARAQLDRGQLALALAKAEAGGAERLDRQCAEALAQARSEAEVPRASAALEAARVAQTLGEEAGRALVAAGAVAARHREGGAKAARLLGEQAAQDLRAKAPPLADQAHAQGAARAQGNQAAVDALEAQLAGLVPGLTGALAGLHTSAQAQLDGAEGAARAELGRLQAEALAALEQARQAGHAALDARTDAAQARISARADAEAQAAEAQAQAQAAGLGELGPGLAELADEGQAGEAVRALVAAERAAFWASEESGAQLSDALDSEADSALDGAEPAELTPGVRERRGALEVQLTQLIAGQAGAGQAAIGEAEASAEAAVGGTLGQGVGLIAEVVGALEADNAAFGAELAAGVDAGLAEALQASAGLAGRAEQAATRADAPWWQEAGEGLWAALNELVAGLAVFVSITAALVLLAVAATGAAVTVALVAACAAAAAAMLTLYGAVQAAQARVAAGQGWAAALGLALPDALGVTALVEAARGVDSVSGQPLTGPERWARGAQAVQALVELVMARRGRGARPGPAQGPDKPTSARQPGEPARLGERPAAPTDREKDPARQPSPEREPLAERAVPQGLAPEAFERACALLQERAGHLDGEIVAQGSRVTGTARPDSDLDVAILVSPERFKELLTLGFGSPVPGSAKARTRQHAVQTGKITARWAGLSALRDEVMTILGVKVDLSVIERGGAFDQPPYISME